MIQVTTPAAVLLIVAGIAAMVLFGRLLMRQYERRMDERAAAQELLRAGDQEANRQSLAAIQSEQQREGKRVDSMSMQLEHLHRSMPLEYVRREDWIRMSVSIDAKLDRIQEMIRSSSVRGDKA